MVKHVIVATALAMMPSIPVSGQTVVSGRIAASTPVSTAPPDMSSDPWCAANAGQAENGLNAAIVYVVNAPQSGDAPSAPAVLDQSDCQYRPGMVALTSGQELLIRNSDETLHNVHVTPQNNRGFNIGQPLKGLESRRSFDIPEEAVPVKCDIHGWMSGHIFIFDHRLFTVASNTGEFTLPALPDGTWTVRVWHAELGSAEFEVVADGTPRTVNVTLQP